MLHELLLALSGHPSPLLSDTTSDLTLLPSLSPPEEALLRSIARLGNLHIEVRKGTDTATKSHPSNVCRAVAQAIRSVHLTSFQEEILRIERGILQEDADLIGAYDTVPLSTIFVAFSGWRHKLEWLKELVQQMQSPSGYASGAQVIDWLRKELRTGFPAIEFLATNLVKAAESTWLRQIAGWVLYGTLPTSGAQDFLIQRNSTSSDADSIYNFTLDLAPGFVTQATASSILFIGKSLEYIRQGSQIRDLQTPALFVGQAALVTLHLQYLSLLEYPINSTSFARTISIIRSSLSRNVLQQLLPLSEVSRAVNMLHDYFLLVRGEFALALITAADNCLSTRQSHDLKEPVYKDTHRLGGMMIKEGEVTAVLTRTWAALATLQDIDDDVADEELELARGVVRLLIKRSHETQFTVPFIKSLGPLQILEKVETTFDDILLATPTYLTLVAGPPLDLFLNDTDIDAYSLIHSYLLAIRRAHLHLTELWKLDALRKPRHLSDSRRDNNGPLKRKQSNPDQRSRSLRSTWAMVGSIMFFLTELGEYLQGEVVRGSREVFIGWLQPFPSVKFSKLHHLSEVGISSSEDEAATTHDPESLTLAHRSYLAALIHSLLLDDSAYTRSLKSLITRVDYIVALVKRLSIVQLSPNLGASDARASMYIIAEEKELMKNLAEIRIGVDGDLQELVKRLQDINFERLGSRMAPMADNSKGTSFVPWKGGELYRLLMKLDFARLRVSDKDHVTG